MSNIDFEVVGNFIKALRKERGWTIEEVSRWIGVTKPAVSQWENGKGIKPEMLYALGKLFGVSVDELVAGQRKEESKDHFIIRNYRLSNYEFDENKCDDNSGDAYFSCLKQIRNKFFSLLKRRVFEESIEDSEEEFSFLKQYFQRDDNYLTYLKYDGQAYLALLSDNDAKEIIKNRILGLSLDDREEKDWELQKFYSIKPEYFKEDLVLKTGSEYLLEKLLSVMNQPEKDAFLANQLEIEETKIRDNGFHKQTVKTKRELTTDEIEKRPYLKTMLANGCNCIKRFDIPSCMEKEDLNHLEGKAINTIEEFSLNDSERLYLNYNGLFTPSPCWKNCSYQEYQSFIDVKRTEYLKALVNLKNSDPIGYYNALKKYYGGE